MQKEKLERAQVRRALEEAVLEVLETMCFEFPVAEPEEGEAPQKEGVHAAARFDGSLKGVLRIALTGEAPRRLAAAFLGLADDEVGERETMQMACELANMLCGATMSRLEPHGRLRIAAPEASRVTGACGGACWLCFPLEAGLLAATLCLEEES
ncbi:MAG: chemotaxis protein CheX [Bryobacteraceae bacterium]